MQAVKVKLGTEEFIGMGTTFKAAKQDCATKALADSKLPKPPERKTLKARPVGITATQELHELATKKGLEAKFKFLEPYNFEFKASMRLWSKEEMRGNYRVQLTCGEFLTISKKRVKWLHVSYVLCNFTEKMISYWKYLRVLRNVAYFEQFNSYVIG
jgi:hypothetical protein